MRPMQVPRRMAAGREERGSRLGLRLARLAVWLIRIAAALLLALPLLLLALWLAG